jgi:hypothetical protein
MITETLGNKKYTLRRVDYQIVGESEALYIEVAIEEDLEFSTRKYNYGLQLSNDETAYFMTTVGGMTPYILSKLVEVGA